MATASHRNSEAVKFVDFDITSQLASLRPGDNVLAIHGMNRLVNSNDFLMVPELVAEKFPEVTTKEATVDTPSITLDGRGWVNVRQILIEGAVGALGCGMDGHDQLVGGRAAATRREPADFAGD